jgi:hypothetical protein
MDETILNWGDGTQGAFNQCSIPKKCAAPPGWGRQPSAAPGFGRAQDPSMNRALVDPGLAEKQRFTHMSNTDKLGVAIRHAALRLPAEARDQAMALVDPANLAIMAGALAVWVGAQATPVGWVVNIAMIGVGVAATGAVAVQVARELRDFAMGVLGADDTADLRAAGDHLAKAVLLVGVDLVVALLLKKAIVKVREPKMPKLEGGEAKPLFGRYDPRTAQRSLPPEKPRQSIEQIKPEPQVNAATSITNGEAHSAKQAADLSKHLGYTAKYGSAGVKQLENGRYRYYGEVQPASKAGEMAGRRYVHEFDPVSGRSRGWHETVDHAGTVRQVRPELNDGAKKHYRFDSNGNYTGSW